MNIDVLKKQHSEILEMIKTINAFSAQNFDANANSIAFNINALSGKLKMHLLSEDQFLYPALMRNTNETVRSVAQTFSKEMGGLADALSAFVQKFNTPFKLLGNGDAFIAESKHVFDLVINRIHRENDKLYPLIET